MHKTKRNIMTKDLFDKYIWLVDTIHRAGRITLREINEKWAMSPLYDGADIPRRTFNNWKEAIQQAFDINIECRRVGGYHYYIENPEDLENSTTRSWLLNTFTVKNIISESKGIRDRIYTVQPWCLKLFNQRWYVCGYCRERDAMRTFALDRIRAYGLQVRYLRSLPLHHSQKETATDPDEECAVFEYRLRPTWDFYSTILSRMDQIEVISPASLREEIRSTVQRIASRYQESPGR